LEQYRQRHGSYPAHYGPPENGPWLIRNGLNYGSDGRTCTLWMMDPLTCGHMWSYSTATRQWRESHDPCFY
jgi:hypothetical protein